MPKKHLNRRSLLRTSGATLAALSSLPLVGSADMDCPDCGGGGGGGGGGGSGSPPSVRTDPAVVSGDRVTVYGYLESLGSAEDAGVYFDFGKQGEGLPNYTNLKNMYGTGGFCDGYNNCWYDSFGSLDPGTYEYRAFAYNDWGSDTGAIRTFTI